jgi:hypothetical protein
LGTIFRVTFIVFYRRIWNIVGKYSILCCDICSREPHLVGEEVFDSQKRKADVPLGFEGESHRLDKMNFFRLRMATRSNKVNHANCRLPDVVEELSPSCRRTKHPTT